jgi:hypothetical protein
MEDEDMTLDIKNFLLSITLFSLVITVLMGATVNLVLEYQNMGYTVDIDTSQAAVFDQAAAINNQTTKMQALVSSSPSNLLSVVSSFLYGAWSALLTTFDSLSLSTSLVLAAGSVLGVPQVIISFIIIGITLSLLFAVIYLLFAGGGQQ